MGGHVWRGAPCHPGGSDQHAVPLEGLWKQWGFVQVLEPYVEQVAVVVGAGLGMEVGVPGVEGPGLERDKVLGVQRVEHGVWMVGEAAALGA